ncbi:unknown [Mycoplasma sp. CAG:877]|jgi:hypothetical protein|nr:unknown [Mycoplasma sp. CAG:877]
MYNYPYPKVGLFSRFSNLAKGFSFTSFLDGTQKTLGVINQAIPIVYQVKPMFQNAKTIFKIADEINKPVTVNETSTVREESNSISTMQNNSNRPIFYI